MDSGKIFLSVRFWHYLLSADEIISKIRRKPAISRSAGEEFVTPEGRKLGRINKETYISYSFPITSYDLIDAIKTANGFLFENIDIVNEIRKDGGRIDYYLTVEQESKFVFEIQPELFRDCSNLGITLGVEIYPERKASVLNQQLHIGLLCLQSIYNLPIIKVEIHEPFHKIRIHFNTMIDIFDPFVKKNILRGEYLLGISDAACRLRKERTIIFSNDYPEEEKVNEFCQYLTKRKIVLYEDISEYDFKITLDNGAVLESLFFALNVDEPVKWVLDKPDGSTYFYRVESMSTS